MSGRTRRNHSDYDDRQRHDADEPLATVNERLDALARPDRTSIADARSEDLAELKDRFDALARQLVERDRGGDDTLLAVNEAARCS